MFKIGQKVICINDSINSETTRYLPMRPKAGKVYTVASIHTEANLKGYGIRLEELLNPSIPWSDGDEKEWSFDARRFRPAVEPLTGRVNRHEGGRAMPGLQSSSVERATIMIVACLYCGAMFYRSRTQIERHYCSHTCSHKDRIEKTAILSTHSRRNRAPLTKKELRNYEEGLSYSRSLSMRRWVYSS